MGEIHYIGGMPLPSDLLNAIDSGCWQAPVGVEVYMRIFGDQPVTPEFYSLQEIKKWNRSWQAMEKDAIFVGGWTVDCLRIEPDRSVVIGSLGPDMPIALDYRRSQEEPRVLYMGGGEIPRWIEIAPRFADLLDQLAH